MVPNIYNKQTKGQLLYLLGSLYHKISDDTKQGERYIKEARSHLIAEANNSEHIHNMIEMCNQALQDEDDINKEMSANDSGKNQNDIEVEEKVLLPADKNILSIKCLNLQKF